jgi:hypothetical protein
LRENVTISYRGAGYEIGRGEHFYGIWPVGSPQSPPIEWWPETPQGWSGAWARFTAIEAPGAIVPVGPATAPVGPATGPVGPGTLPAGPGTASVFGKSIGVVTSAALLLVGVVCGIVGLFPGYLDGVSLAQQPPELVPHLIYLAVWGASAALILLGGTRTRVGAFLGLGASIVTFGLFFADAGQAIAGGAHVMGAGLVLGLVGWLACAAGSAVAFRLLRVGTLGKPHGDEVGPVAMLMLAALGAAIAFAPSWDSYDLHTASGASQSVTLGNAFSNPAAVIAGDVVVMVALVAVVAGAALWRPIRFGAALLAGAIIPMVAQAISAFIQVSETTSPALFGFSSAQASAAGLTISNGLTAVFWIYCAFVVAMIASCAWMLMTPHSAVPQRPVPPQPPQAAGAWPTSAPGVTELSAIPAPDSGSSA